MSDTARQNEHPPGTESIQLPPMSPSALARFNHDFPKILELVREKYDLEMKYLGQSIPREQQRLAEEVHRQFGDLLRASYEFHRYDQLQE